MSTAPESRFRCLLSTAVSAVPFVFFAFEKFLRPRQDWSRAKLLRRRSIHCLDQKFLTRHHAGRGQVIPYNR